MVYKRELINQLGGLREPFEGSQDFDLILRASDNPNLKVSHISKVLYHWRQHEQSVSLEHEVKDYIYQSGISALAMVMASSPSLAVKMRHIMSLSAFFKLV
jgi:hypothetical protein